jgi:hypothetical protein
MRSEGSRYLYSGAPLEVTVQDLLALEQTRGVARPLRLVDNDQAVNLDFRWHPVPSGVGWLPKSVGFTMNIKSPKVVSIHCYVASAVANLAQDQAYSLPSNLLCRATAGRGLGNKILK